MLRKPLAISLPIALLWGVASAEVPRVAVDIAPVHSLVDRVMEGVGAASLIVPPGASPHEYSLRPSEASALQEADVVFWVSADLTPWLEDAIETLAADATVTALLEAEGTQVLAFREGALFEAHDHGDDHDDHGHDDHDDHDDHAHDDHDDHDDHAHDDHDDHAHDDHDDHAHDDHDDHAHDDHDDHAHDDHDDHAHDDHDHGHHHGEYDPHAWLSPDNAISWLKVIAAELSAADPDNASAYFSNAAAAQVELEALAAEIDAILDPVRSNKRFVVFHDAYQYFETAFDIYAVGAISIGDASDPSPARIAEIQGRIREEGIDCVLSEPQYNPGLVATVLDGTEAATAVIDPLGSDLEPGPMLYQQLLRNLATNLASCL